MSYQTKNLAERSLHAIKWNYLGTIGRALAQFVSVVVLARLGIMSVQKLKDFRSYFIVIAFIVAAVVTPPDVVSQLALAIPMCLLYELGIWAAVIFIKHTQAPVVPQDPVYKEPSSQDTNSGS